MYSGCAPRLELCIQTNYYRTLVAIEKVLEWAAAVKSARPKQQHFA